MENDARKVNPILVAAPDPLLDSGTTQFFVGGETRSLARLNYSRARSMMAYAYWDPYKNNSGPSAGKSVRDSALGLFQVLGKLRIGTQQSYDEFNFDIPWGKFVAIPVCAEQCEISARLIRPVTALNPTYIEFNDPPTFTLPPGVTLPDITGEYPNGFVAVTGLIAEGSSTPNNSAPPQRGRSYIPLGAATSSSMPIAYGARRVRALADPAAGVVLTFLDGVGGTIAGLLPANTTIDIPVDAVVVAITNPAALGVGVALIFDLGI